MTPCSSNVQYQGQAVCTIGSAWQPSHTTHAVEHEQADVTPTSDRLWIESKYSRVAAACTWSAGSVIVRD